MRINGFPVERGRDGGARRLRHQDSPPWPSSEDAMNPTPTELLMEFAHAIQDTVGHRRSIQPNQEPLTDREMDDLKRRIDANWEELRYGTSE